MADEGGANRDRPQRRSRAERWMLAERVIRCGGRLSPTEKLVWVEYATYDSGRGAYPSEARLCDELDIAPRTLKAARQRLVDLGLLGRRRRKQEHALYWIRDLPADWPVPPQADAPALPEQPSPEGVEAINRLTAELARAKSASPTQRNGRPAPDDEPDWDNVF